MSFGAGSVTYSSRFPNTTIPHAEPLAWAACREIGSHPPRLEQAPRHQFAHLFTLIRATSLNDPWLIAIPSDPKVMFVGFPGRRPVHQRTAFDDWRELLIRRRGWVLAQPAAAFADCNFSGFCFFLFLICRSTTSCRKSAVIPKA